MRMLSSKEVDLVAGGQSTVFIGSPFTHVDASAALKEVGRTAATMAAGGFSAPGPITIRLLGALGGATLGAALAAYNIGNHTRVLTPRITITEMGTAPLSGTGLGGGSDFD